MRIRGAEAGAGAKGVRGLLEGLHGREEGIHLGGLFPREAGLAEVAVVGGLAVDRAEQVELLDDVRRLEREGFQDGRQV